MNLISIPSKVVSCEKINFYRPSLEQNVLKHCSQQQWTKCIKFTLREKKNTFEANSELKLNPERKKKKKLKLLKLKKV